MTVTTASLSRNFMRKLGWTSETVEKRHGIFRNDLFGFADVISYKSGSGILLVQAYLRGKEKEHSHLNSENKAIKEWLLSRGLFEHHIWKKTSKKRGGRKHWEVVRREILI